MDVHPKRVDPMSYAPSGIAIKLCCNVYVDTVRTKMSLAEGAKNGRFRRGVENSE